MIHYICKTSRTITAIKISQTICSCWFNASLHLECAIWRKSWKGGGWYSTPVFHTQNANDVFSEQSVSEGPHYHFLLLCGKAKWAPSPWPRWHDSPVLFTCMASVCVWINPSNLAVSGPYLCLPAREPQTLSLILMGLCRQRHSRKGWYVNPVVLYSPVLERGIT